MKDFWSQLRDQCLRLWGGMSVPQRLTLTLFVACSILLVGALSYWSGNPSYVPLVSGLSTEEITAASNKLKDAKIAFRYEATKGMLTVPSGKVDDARMVLASMGLPNENRKGEGFDLFDKDSFGMTDFVQKVNYLRALQGTLEKKVAAMDGIDKAHVTLSIPEEEVFVRDQPPPKASVEIKLRRGRDISGGQVSAIRHLIASAVPKLKPQNVAVMDFEGRLLARFQNGDDSFSLAGDQMETRSKVERHLQEKVSNLLDHALGSGRAAVEVSAQLDFQASERTIKKMDPESQVMLDESSQQSDSQNTSGPGGVPGVKSNTPGTDAPGAGGTSTSQVKKEKTVNNKYHYDTVTEVVRPEMGSIKRISVAVLVKPRLVTTAPPAAGAAADPNAKAEKKVESLSASDLARLTEAVKNAVGYSAERKDVVKVENAPEPAMPEEAFTPFVATTTAVPLTDQAKSILPMAGTVLACLVLALMFWKSMKQVSAPVPEPVPPTIETSTENAVDASGKPIVVINAAHKALQGEIAQLVTKNSNQATEIIRSMLNR